MDTVTIDVAKTNLSQLISRVEAGEEIIIARGKDSVAKLVPIHPAKSRRQFGRLKGKVWVGPEFFEPPPEEELKSWEGR